MNSIRASSPRLNPAGMPFENLAAKSPDDYADDGSTNGSHDDDWRIGFGDDGVGGRSASQKIGRAHV